MSRSRRSAGVRRRGRMGSRLAVVVPLGLLAAYGAGGPAASALPSNCTRTGGTVTCTFTETGAPVTWPVPAGVTSAALTLYGGSGGSGGGPDNAGGTGAEVTATVSLAGVSALTVNVAGVGGSAAKTGTGGYGGGGTGGDNGHTGGGGGGGTAVSDSGGTLLIAGGGGGGGADAGSVGGVGGNADTGGRSGQGLAEMGATVGGGGGGGAGTQTAGGGGGTGGTGTSSSSCCASPGSKGNPGSSGQGGGVPPSNDSGGGGGGGFFGGGQGGQSARLEPPCGDDGGQGGGGGGSSFTGGPGISGAVVNDHPSASAALGGNGEVLISYIVDADLAITPPANITVDATGPAGATVSYPAPVVTDPDDASPPAASCTPKSGSVFAIGTTTVQCSATDSDDTPSTVSTSFTVTVRGAAALLADLYQAVRGTGLASTVAAAQREVAAGQASLACVMLRMFEVEVEAEVPFAISPARAATLVADATRIRAVLGCSNGSLF